MRVYPILISLLLGAASLFPAASLNDLYFGLDNMRGFAEVYWWFHDGHVIRSLPQGGAAANFDAACKASPALCGTYTLNGDKLAVTFPGSQPENWTYKTLNGGIQLNYLILTPVGKYPAGARLNGTWSRAYSSKVHSGPGSNTTITSPSFYTFKPDGTFMQQAIAGVDTESNVKGANISSSQQFKASGTYTLRDNSLTLVKDGKTEQHMVFPVGDNLNFDGVVYTKEK